ncbi:hypothetical protein WPS_19510 [Vulcanimicrobium alpinum]|uniref:Uncharacterized protein n=1 Tax=Vulcanimicrobium alpinum TaxID=3016050 RepID=A0AAN2C9L9_UNVUL|nr:hypothetical protein [Vulcanimicrobium alpinum]BDE06675.1 hypothetical protein WPS_19510 [Vulcanimicrobium alpinum]
MKLALWRACAVALSTMLLILLSLSAIAAVVANASPGFSGTNELAHPGSVIVEQITDPAAVQPPLHRGDRVALADRSLPNRLRFAQGRPGDRFALTGTGADGTP